MENLNTLISKIEGVIGSDNHFKKVQSVKSDDSKVHSFVFGYKNKDITGHNRRKYVLNLLETKEGHIVYAPCTKADNAKIEESEFVNLFPMLSFMSKYCVHATRFGDICSQLLREQVVSH